MGSGLTCPHGMPSPKSCYSCMEEGPVDVPSSWIRVGLPFRARYDGTCRGCDEPIFSSATKVQRWDKGSESSAYLHEDCTPR